MDNENSSVIEAANANIDEQKAVKMLLEILRLERENIHFQGAKFSRDKMTNEIMDVIRRLSR